MVCGGYRVGSVLVLTVIRDGIMGEKRRKELIRMARMTEKTKRFIHLMKLISRYDDYEINRYAERRGLK
jgi:hypothetical protein